MPNLTALTVALVLSYLGYGLFLALTVLLYRSRGGHDPLSWLALGVLLCGAGSLAIRSPVLLL